MLFRFLIITILLFFNSCANIVIEELSDDNKRLPSANSIRILPPSTVSVGPLGVSILSNTDVDSVIHYTIDGSEPTCESPVYDGSSIVISSDSVVKAIACNKSYTPITQSAEEEYDFVVYTSSWQQLSTSSVSIGTTTSNRITVDSNKDPIIAYIEGSSLKVKKFDGTNWIELGAGTLPAYIVTNMDLISGQNEELFVSYRGSSTRGANVIKYEQGNWEKLGASNFSGRDIEYINIVRADNGELYVIFTVAIDDVASNYALKVMKFNKSSNSWENLGELGLNNMIDCIFDITLSNSHPVIAYTTPVNGLKKLFAKIYEGGSWHNLGTGSLSLGEVASLSINTDSTGVPYIAFTDSTNGNKISVIKYNQMTSSWSQLGASVSSGSASELSLKFSPHNVPYLAFSDSSVGRSLQIKMFNGSSWELIEKDSNLTYAMVGSLDIAFSDDGVLYTSFSDYDRSTRTFAAKLLRSPEDPMFSIKNITVPNGDNLSLEITNTKSYTETYYTLDGTEPDTNSSLYSGAINITGIDKTFLVNAITIGEMYRDDSRISSTKFIFRPNDAWHSVGNFAFSLGAVATLDFAHDTNNIFVVYRDTDHGSVVGINKYNYTNNTWEIFNKTGLPSIDITDSKIAISAGNMYLALLETSKQILRVYKYDTSLERWVQIGSDVDLEIASFDFAVDVLNNIYLAYSVTSGYLKLMWYDGADWKPIEENISKGEAKNIRLLIENDSQFISYIDSGLNNSATVVKYNKGSKEVLGSEGFSNKDILYLDLSLGSNGYFVAFYDTIENSQKIYHYDGATWKEVFSDKESGTNSQILSIGKTIYFAFKLASDNSIKLFSSDDGVDWKELKKGRVSEAGVGEMVLGDVRSIIHILYSDSENNNKATIMKLGVN